MKKIARIEGEKVHTLEEFFSVVNDSLVPPGTHVEKNMESFNEVLKNAFNDSGGIDIVWENASLSQKNLGEENFQKIIDIIRSHGPGGASPRDDVHLHLA